MNRNESGDSISSSSFTRHTKKRTSRARQITAGGRKLALPPPQAYLHGPAPTTMQMDADAADFWNEAKKPLLDAQLTESVTSSSGLKSQRGSKAPSKESLRLRTGAIGSHAASPRQMRKESTGSSFSKAAAVSSPAIERPDWAPDRLAPLGMDMCKRLARKQARAV
eukprot:706193-Pleurochrysis_carterae.AAC.1